MKWKYQSETVGKAIWPWAWTSTWLPLPSGQLEICQYGRKCVLLKFKIPRFQFDKIDLQCSQFRTSINWKHIARTILIGWPPPSFQEGISSRKEKLPTETNIFQYNPHTMLHKCTGWRIFCLIMTVLLQTPFKDKDFNCFICVVSSQPDQGILNRGFTSKLTDWKNTWFHFQIDWLKKHGPVQIDNNSSWVVAGWQYPPNVDKKLWSKFHL